MNVATKKEWLASLRQEPAKYDRMVIVPRLVALLVGTIMLIAGVGYAFAEPMAIARVNNGQVVITVYTEDCQLTDTVSNLPKRATWVQEGKTFEGCVGVQPEAGVAFFYFREDKTVAVVPLQMFARATGV